MIKQKFFIQDLENLSGIKAHTIRTWEKRYSLFKPERHGKNNIRTYTLSDLQRILSLAYLLNFEYKISHLAEYSDAELHRIVQSEIHRDLEHQIDINTLMLSTIQYDREAFLGYLEKLHENLSYSDIIQKILIPFLHQIGTHWQTNLIVSGPEHFASHLIRQYLIKLVPVQNSAAGENVETFILFLPENELHEIGLLILHYELCLRNKPVIFLGPTTPIDALVDVLQYVEKPTLVCHSTIHPYTENVNNYLIEIQSKCLASKDVKLIFIRRTDIIKKNIDSDKVLLFNNLYEFIKIIEK
ncbi:MAG: MerR family transcriptional regulator [Saprospiraceae bacterium]